MNRARILPAAIAAWWLLVLLLALPLPLAPPRPAEIIALDGTQFVAPLGVARVDAAGLRVEALAGADGALQVHPLPAIEAARFPVLRYRMDALPRTLELALVFRRQDDPDLQVVTIAGAGAGAATVRLADLPAWRGRIVELGFAQYPGAQSVPPTRAFQPFTVVGAELWSPSWHGALAARLGDWVGRRSWTFLAMSALGPDTGMPRGASLPLVLAIAVAGSLLLALLLARGERRRIARAAAIAAAVAWLALDLRWLHGLHARHQGTRDIYAGMTAVQRGSMPADQDLLRAALRARSSIPDGEDNLPVLVDAGSDFQRARLYYHLLPLNVAPMNTVGAAALTQLPAAILVVYAPAAPVFDAVAGTVVLSGATVPARLLMAEGHLQVYRIGTPPP
jgi:hypothetical protein